MTATKEIARPGNGASRTGGETKRDSSCAFPLSRSHPTTTAGERQDKNARYRTTTDNFAAVKEAVSVPEAATFYGFTPNRAGFICCPFHAEKTPSCKLDERRWHCFGCQTGGTVIDFTARLFDLSPLEAVKRLNADFSLGLSLDRHAPTPEELSAARKRREERKARELFADWKARAEWSLTRCAGIGYAALLDKTPDTLSEAETLAVHKWQYWEYLYDRLHDGTEAEQLAILGDWPNIGAALEFVLKEARNNG